MHRTDETPDMILRDMFADSATDNAGYRIRCYANRMFRALRRERKAAELAKCKELAQSRTTGKRPSETQTDGPVTPERRMARRNRRRFQSAQN